MLLTYTFLSLQTIFMITTFIVDAELRTHYYYNCDSQHMDYKDFCYDFALYKYSFKKVSRAHHSFILLAST